MPTQSLSAPCCFNAGNRLHLTDCGNGQITCTFMLGDSTSIVKTIITEVSSLSLLPLLRYFGEIANGSGSEFNPKISAGAEPLLFRCRWKNYRFFLLPPSEGDDKFQPLNGIAPDTDDILRVVDFLKASYAQTCKERVRSISVPAGPVFGLAG